MLYLFKLLFFSINIDSKSIFNWFENKPLIETNNYTNTIILSKLEVMSTSKLTVQSVIVELLKQIQDGLTLSDIENLLIVILITRFIILTIKYNLKTSFYITVIGLFAGYLWYRHLIDLLSMYRSMLIKLPYVHKLGIDAIQLKSVSQQIILTDSKLGNDVHWYNPGQLIYYAFTEGIKNINSETGIKYYIDPISMLISNLNESEKIHILPTYYKMYNKVIPQVVNGISKFWTQLSGIAAYAVITRIGKKYCPYLVRWHWTFLLIIGFIEQIFIYFCYRVSFFQSHILIPQSELTPNQSLTFQINFLTGILTFVICFHIGLIFFGLFHAIWGQYFYFPFFVENTELHIGPRPKNSVYSGGQTSWQDEKKKNIQRVYPKLWYGWFGHGIQKKQSMFYLLQNLIRVITKKLNLRFRK